MRKIKQFERKLPDGTTRKAVAYYHTDWQEYFVKFWIDDVLQQKATYPASDKTDAIATADYFVNREM